jgi:hypothetical protein
MKNFDQEELPFQGPDKEKNNDIDESEKNQNEINNINNAIFQNILNNNQNIFDNNREIEEADEIDNLRYKDNINMTPSMQQRLDSCDSQMANHFKFSIDNPNVPKQRLHEYLSDDLLNALEVSPNIPNINNGITNNNNKKISISNENNDTNDLNNLIGFSLYPQSDDNNNNNNYNNNNYNNENKKNAKDLSVNNDNNNNNNKMINNNNNNNFTNNNNTKNKSNLNYNINNPQIYIPTKLRNKEQASADNNNTQFNIYQNQNQKKDEANNPKNKYDKKNIQFNKKEGKIKKHFEVRAGDWTCSKCNNLNFSFRQKCNRCGLPKELNVKIESMNSDMFNQNKNYQMMNCINPNYIYSNNINNVNINIKNINNPNGNIKYYPK